MGIFEILDISLSRILYSCDEKQTSIKSFTMSVPATVKSNSAFVASLPYRAHESLYFSDVPGQIKPPLRLQIKCQNNHERPLKEVHNHTHTLTLWPQR
jgi:hypothetical protein